MSLDSLPRQVSFVQAQEDSSAKILPRAPEVGIDWLATGVLMHLYGRAGEERVDEASEASDSDGSENPPWVAHRRCGSIGWPQLDG